MVISNGSAKKRGRPWGREGCRVERSAPCCRVRPPPHRTVRAGFPHTALRVGLVSSVSLPFASRLRFTLIPMDAPPYGRAVSDAPPHSGLSPIAVFRHYSSRHLICIVPFFTQRPFAPLLGHRFATRLRLGGYPRALPRFPATTASSDYCFRFRYSQSSQVPLQNFRSTPPPLPRRALSHLNRVGAEVLVSRIQRR